jgi:hypothetical protein
MVEFFIGNAKTQTKYQQLPFLSREYHLKHAK